MKFLTSSWMVIVLGSLLYLGTTAAVLMKNKSALVPPPAAEKPDKAAEIQVRGPSWDFFNPDLDQMIGELKTRKEELDEREKHLKEFAARLQSERQEITQITQQVHQMQAELDQAVIHIKEEEQANLKKMAKTYATMTPEAAANILRGLSDITLVKVLVFMKEAESAPILEELTRKGEAEAKRVALVYERLRLTQSRNKTTAAANK
jgi:flagellar motility protein MotE (MotC chaperone)